MQTPGSRHNLWADYSVLIFICILSFAIYVINNDFPLYFHADEIKKLNFVLHGEQDFKHPILLLQLARLVNVFFREVDHQSLMIICRTVSAIATVGIVIAGFFIARHVLQKEYDWFATILIASSPIIVVHAHYFKEDMVFTASAMFTLLFYIKFLQHQTRKHLIWLCVATGFALSAQYKAVLLIPLILLYPLLDHRIDRQNIYKRLFIMTGGAMVIALAVNFPAITNPEQLFWGISKETGHLSYGHTIKIYPLPQFFSFHLLNSLLPGLTAPVLALGIFGLVSAILRWRIISTGYRVLIVYILIYYFAHELTPMKPSPGFVRYMVPVSPPLIIFSVSGLILIRNFLCSSSVSKFITPLSATLLIAVVSFPVYKSVMLISNFNLDDTRIAAFQWLSERKEEGEVYFGKQTLLPNKQSGRIYTLDEARLDNLRSAGFKYAVASSFGYDVYNRGAELKGQIKKVYRAKERFDEIFRTYPYHEIKPEYASFAYSNPVIRIIDISKKPLN